MSKTVYYRPLPVEPEGKYLGYAIKKILVECLGKTNSNWSQDGSLETNWTTIGKSMIPFLEGVSVAGSEELSRQAKKLIDEIKKHEKVQVRIRD